ncbi:MAG: hypothetical protein NTW86_11840, partial [Candidatus Sumerlaeota bacterium]|nr:hypothetical protein [Candidatus Sumerlaeota bacterium]
MLTPPEEIIRRVDAVRPMRGAAIPADLGSHLGATHFAGKYCMTDEPFLIGGLRQLQGFGFKVAKLWFSNRIQNGYRFHSSWPEFTGATRLIDVAKTPYFRQAFAMPFDAFFLETSVSGSGGWAEGAAEGAACYKNEEEQ